MPRLFGNPVQVLGWRSTWWEFGRQYERLQLLRYSVPGLKPRASGLFFFVCFGLVHIHLCQIVLVINSCLGASLVVQWLRICLPMQGTRGSSPDPGRSHMLQSNEARAPQLLSLRSGAHEPQPLKLARLEPVLRSKRSHCNEKPAQRRVAPARRN